MPPARKSHCIRGHSYAGRNLYISPDGRQNCNACRRLADIKRGQINGITKETLADRVLRFSMPEPNTGCWLWLGACDRAGYGHICPPGGLRTNVRLRRAHCASYFAFVDSIPSDMLVCHKCDTPSCVNPQHLWLGTPRENILDMLAKGRRADNRKSHCLRGHGFTPENTGMAVGGKRFCRICRRARDNESKRLQRRHKAASAIPTPEALR